VLLLLKFNINLNEEQAGRDSGRVQAMINCRGGAHSARDLLTLQWRLRWRLRRGRGS
jgi:hypothetical protein